MRPLLLIFLFYSFFNCVTCNELMFAGEIIPISFHLVWHFYRAKGAVKPKVDFSRRS